MVSSQGAARSIRHRLAWKLMTGAAILVLASGCNRTGKKQGPSKQLASFNYSKQGQRPALKPTNPLYIAATKWARVHQKKPADPVAALNYARTLKALGAKDKAVEVLARTYQLNPGNAKLASEYGRLALDLGKVQLAERLLNQAQRAKGRTDWRVLSALGTVNAKRGKHKKAQSYYLAALREKPDATSVFNNLALSYALDGRVGDAENLLKRAVAKGHNTRRVRQNLALVLNLQSKFGEAQQVALADLNGDKVDKNVNFMRDMVKPARMASAKPKDKAHANTGAVTTAALALKKKKAAGTSKFAAKTPLPRRNPSAKVKTAPATARAQAVKKVSRRVAAKSAQPVVSHPPPAKVPEKSAKVAAARVSSGRKSTAKTKPGKRAAVLPWRKKPAATPRPRRTARLSKKSPGPPTQLGPRTKPDWSVTVTQNVAPAPRVDSAAAPKAPGSFEFPGPE